MTKLVTVRVVVPSDDGVTTEEVQLALRSLLEPLPVGRVGSEENPGRIHWSAVDVLRAAAPPSPDAPAAPPRTKTKKVVAGQGVMP